MLSLTFLSGFFLFLAVGGLKTGAFFMWLALLPLLVLVYRAPSKTSAFWYSSLGGFIFFLAQISWFLSAAPLDWAGIESPILSYFLAGLAWLFTSAVLGLFVGGFGLLLKYFPLNSWWYSAPALFAVSEYARAWGFGLWWLGKESLLGPHWTFGTLGYASVNFSGLLNLSKLVGLYGMTFFVALSSVLFFCLWLRLTDKRALLPKGFYLGLIIFSLAIAMGFLMPLYEVFTYRNVRKIKKVGLIQSNFLQEFRLSDAYFFSRAQTNFNKIKEIKTLHPDTELIILPESSWVTSFLGVRAPGELGKLAELGSPFVLIDSGRTLSYGPSPGRVLYLDSQKGLVAYKNKDFLIPGGEYLPYSIKALVRILEQEKWLKEFNNARLPLRDLPPPSNLDGSLREEGVLICSGIFSPQLYYDLAKGSAEILVNTASQSTFRGNKLFLDQAEAMIRFTAASSDRFFLQAANGGLNYVIDNNGALIKKSSNLGFEALTGEVEYRHTKYPALWIQSWLILSLAVLLSFDLVKEMRRNRV